MALVRIDLQRLNAAITGSVPNKADIQRAIQGIGAAAYQKWKSLAQKGLKATSRDYVDGITVTYKEQTVLLDLVGTLPNQIEQGWSGGDMRAWMLKSPKAKMGKNGRYLIIPFRHGTPGTSGRNVGPPMPSSIHQVAKSLAPTISRPGGVQAHGGGEGNTQWGGRLHPGLSMKESTRKTLKTKAKPHHVSPLYMGMIRKEKTYEKATQSQYSTFRTITERSNGKGHWIHPGIKARRFAPKVQKHVEAMAGAIIATAMGSK